MSSQPPRLGVGAIAVHDGALLLVRRGKQPAYGMWSLPGGHLERDELLAEAVKREMREETGVEVEVGALAGVFEIVGDAHLVVLDFFVEVRGHPAPSPGGDALDARWVPFDDVERLECTPRFLATMRSWGVLPSADEQSD